MNYLKARASYGTTGKDAGTYLLQSVYLGNPVAVANGDIYDINFPLNGQTGFSKGNQIGNPGLKPELTTTLELGLDAGFFNDKLSLAYTYYSSNHNDQIVTVSLPASAGFVIHQEMGKSQIKDTK
ncbi:MAG: TonB-dependent receptor [Saprospiraceae bacterium]|nr:TonB-dependent receptor [Saprospiraceae bacterium]